MKRLTAILLAVVLMMTFLTGCGKKRELYSKVKLENYVEVKDYNGIEIDTQSEDFYRTYLSMLYGDLSENKISNDSIKDVVKFDASNETTVELGDMVNIDYVGYNGETAFDGGAAEGALLIIGSGTFIDDFEDELIGAKVGNTVEVSAKFPENYSSEELAGVNARFVVTINSIAKNPEQVYSLYDFETEDEYKADIKKRTVKQYILDAVIDNSKISDYPKKDSELIGDAIFEFYTDMFKQVYNVDLEEYIVANGLTVEDYKSQMATQMMNVNMIMYYIFDAEELELLESTLNSQDVEQPVIAESYAVQDIVMEYLYDNAKIK